MGNHNSFNLNHKEQLHSSRINAHNKDPTLGMLPMEKLGKVHQYSLYFYTRHHLYVLLCINNLNYKKIYISGLR